MHHTVVVPRRRLVDERVRVTSGDGTTDVTNLPNQDPSGTSTEDRSVRSDPLGQHWHTHTGSTIRQFGDQLRLHERLDNTLVRLVIERDQARRRAFELYCSRAQGPAKMIRRQLDTYESQLVTTQHEKRIFDPG
jgi:hypothetical protein